MRIFNMVLLCILFASILAIGILISNPLGISQRIFFDQQPPYHWVQQDVSHNSPGSMRETYNGINGNTCATVYRYATFGNTFTVYGFGFNNDYQTQADAETAAEKECR